MIKTYKSGQQTALYEVLDYIITSAEKLDTDVNAKNGITVEADIMLTSPYYLVYNRLFSTNDPTDYSGQNGAYASGVWGLQFENRQLCIKPLGFSDNFYMINIYYNDLQNNRYKYNLSCAGILNIYNYDGTLKLSADCSSVTDPNKVSQTYISFFCRDITAPHEFTHCRCYDLKIYDNGTLIRHYIPVKRLSDNIIGFYEIITETFLTSVTSTDFTGTSKSIPEYIDESSRTTKYVNDIIINGTQINRIYLNGEVYWGGEITQQALYEVLDEIHATSNPAYILTDYSPVQDTIIEVKYKVNGNYVNNHNERIFSTYPSAWNDACTVDANYSSQGLAVKFPNPPSSSGWFNNLATRDTTSSHILRVAMNECYYDGTLVATGNGTFEPSSSSIIIESVATQSSNDQGYYNLYYFNIYENNTTVRQYVPVRRISDDEIGFYDYVNQDFIAVNGTFAYTSKSTPEYIY